MSEIIVSEDSLKSKTSSTNSLENGSLCIDIHKSISWLFDLIELHYFPYNSCNSLTIYSYKYWSSQKKIIVATKENNVKEVYFRTSYGSFFNNDESSIENHAVDSIISPRSSVSSNTSNPNQIANQVANEDESNRKNSIVNSTVMTDEKSNYSSVDLEYVFLEPMMKIHKFPKIKSEASVSAIDIFDVNNFSVLTVAFVLKRKPEYFLHIYCDFETKNLELITEYSEEFELNTMPHRLSHLKLFKNENNSINSETFILVNCSQKYNLLFEIDLINRKFNQVEKPETLFIEFSGDNLLDNITCHDMKYLNSQNNQLLSHFDRRLTALGGQNGWIGVFFIDSNKNEILKFWEQENDSFITQLEFFTTKCYHDWSSIDIEKTKINMLALRSLEPTRIFNNVLFEEDDFESFEDLDISANYDLVSSAVIYDATFAGFNSIVLGTFGRALLFFCPSVKKYQEYDKQAINCQSELDQSQKSEINNKIVKSKFVYELKREITLKNSILGLSTGLVSNNGAIDLVVYTLNGISIWQYDPDKLIDFANKLLEKKETSSLENSYSSFKKLINE